MNTTLIRTNTTVTLLSFMLILGVVLSSIPVYADDAKEARKNILVLNSYHRGFKASDETLIGIEATLKDSYSNYNLHVEYMDTKRHFGDEYWSNLKTLYNQKYKRFTFDIIIATDNNAFEFLKQYHDEIFPDTPIVFSGYNWLKKSAVDGFDNVTGVNEEGDLAKGIELILQLHPDTKKVFFITDTTSSGKLAEQECRKILPEYTDRLQFEVLKEYSMEGLLEKIRGLSKDSLVFYLTFYIDKDGNYFAFDEVLTNITENSPVPVYITFEWLHGFGAFGGWLTNQFAQGKKVAELAIDVLNGRNINDIELIMSTPSRYMFEYSQLEKWGIPLASLPPESILSNKPFSFYETYTRYIWGSFGTFFLLVLFIVVLTANIVKRKKAEKALQQSYDGLDRKVQERTSELATAKEKAETANRAKSMFLANMSHELRTPLNAILGFSQMMQDDSETNSVQSRNLKIINRSGNHLLQLINDVLDMSKIDAGQMQLELKDFDLSELVRDISDMMRVRAEDKGLQLNLDQSSDFPRFIHADAVKLRQIFINLLSNSIKFTQSGGITLRLDASGDDSNGGLILHGEVEDTGIGIKPEDLGRIFQPFEQLAESISQKGTGLGLAITRQFVEMMQGDIGAESTPGKGSLFHFKFLVEKAKGEVVAKDAAGQLKVIGLDPGQPEYRILIAEDQPESALLLRQLLEPLGFKIRIAENGKQAVEQFQQWHPHLIWMDRRMPVMNGEEATRTIRKLPEGQEVKIIALTASAFSEEKDTVMAAGMDDFITKPFRPEELFDCMIRQLGLRFQYREPAEKEEAASAAPLDSKAIVALPHDFLSRLLDAAESGDGKEARVLIDSLAKEHEVTGSGLAKLVESYQFDQLVQLIQVAMTKKEQTG